MNWSPHVTVAAVTERDGRFLLVEERIEDGLRINQPAGHLEDGEGLDKAVVRETREETGRVFTPQGLVGVYRWRNRHNAETFLRFAFYGEVSERDPDRDLDPDISRCLWLSPRSLAAQRSRLRSPLVWICIQDYLRGQRYPVEVLGDVV
jgi:ADP-ribose pyrophosphatase YjhB (NUDIX family)